ncbi:hypothetical protein G5I_12711 [Acromyrmex echinatior]|uniref:Uncharacterized protein n=1 Tax=Acromyrmex echinatior TaxID=103372 RepID=F4X321_ACREC|nr:hypothetical protein G5I_12711 [Acromyrmex echinatior]
MDNNHPLKSPGVFTFNSIIRVGDLKIAVPRMVWHFPSFFISTKSKEQMKDSGTNSRIEICSTVLAIGREDTVQLATTQNPRAVQTLTFPKLRVYQLRYTIKFTLSAAINTIRESYEGEEFCPLASMNSSFPGKRHSNGRSKIILKTSAMTKYPYMGQPETNSRIVPSLVLRDKNKRDSPPMLLVDIALAAIAMHCDRTRCTFASAQITPPPAQPALGIARDIRANTFSAEFKLMQPADIFLSDRKTFARRHATSSSSSKLLRYSCMHISKNQRNYGKLGKLKTFREKSGSFAKIFWEIKILSLEIRKSYGTLGRAICEGNSEGKPYKIEKKKDRR